MKPSDKPTWMAVVAAFATFQVLLFYVDASYRIIIDILELLEKMEKMLSKDKDEL